MFNNEEELKAWLIDYIKKNGKRSLHVAIRNSKNIQNDIVRFTNYLEEGTPYNVRCYHIISGIKEMPVCKTCGDKVNFNKQTQEYRIYCSSKCSINEETKAKMKETLIKKYGVDNISKSEYFKELIIKHNQEKYGVDWYQQTDEFREKSFKTLMEKYGVTHYSKTDEFINKIKKTFLDKYGVDWYTKSSEFNEKYKKWSLGKYGTEHPMKNKQYKEKIFSILKEGFDEDCEYLFQTNLFKEKSKKTRLKKYGNENYINTEQFKKTCIKKYGTEHYMQNFDFLSKHIKRCFKHKKYKLPSGNTVKVQGYEPYALDILLKKYNENDLLISDIKIKEEIGILNYIMDDNDRVYLPDIYIKSENKIIEVKSNYTYNLELEKNCLKKESCLDMGLNFEFWIFTKNKELSII